MDKEKKTLEDFSELSQEEIENSTIFSKPKIVDKKPPKKKKGKLMVALKLVLAVAVIAAVFGGVYYIRYFVVPPVENQEETASQTADETRNIVTENSIDDVKSVELINANGTFEFYPADSSVNSDEDEQTDKLWYIKGLDKKYTDTIYTRNTVEDCAIFQTDGIYDSEDTIDFSNPSAEVEVKLNNGKEYSIIISEIKGEESKLGGAYAKVSGDENIYFLKKEFVEYFTYDTTHYIDYIALTAIEKTEANSEYFGEGLERFDYIEISGKDVREDYRFEMYEKGSGSTKYKMVSPYEFKVNNASMVNIVSLLKENLDNTGIMGIAYYDRNGLSEKTLKKYGLDDPAAVVEYKVADEVVTIRLQDKKVIDPKSDDYEYLMIVNSDPVIYEVTKNSFDYFDWEPSDFASDDVIEEDVSEVKRLTVGIDGKQYLFETETKTVVDEETEEETTETVVVYDGKNIDYSLFEQYYGYIASVKPFVSSAMFEKPENIQKYCEIKIENVDSNVEDSRLTIYKISDNESRYYIELDGKPTGLCPKEEADKIANSITKLIKNKELK